MDNSTTTPTWCVAAAEAEQFAAAALPEAAEQLRFEQCAHYIRLNGLQYNQNEY